MFFHVARKPARAEAQTDYVTRLWSRRRKLVARQGLQQLQRLVWCTASFVSMFQEMSSGACRIPICTPCAFAGASCTKQAPLLVHAGRNFLISVRREARLWQARAAAWSLATNRFVLVKPTPSRSLEQKSEVSLGGEFEERQSLVLLNECRFS